MTGMRFTISALAASVMMTPRTCDRDGWSTLSALQGEWSVSMKYRTSPGHYAVSAAKSSIRLGSTPCSLIDEVQGELAGKPISFLSLLAVPEPRKVERAYIDSEHGRIVHYRGDIRGSKVMFIMDFPASSKFIATADIEVIGPTHFTVTHGLSMDGGKTSSKVVELVYRR